MNTSRIPWRWMIFILIGVVAVLVGRGASSDKSGGGGGEGVEHHAAHHQVGSLSHCQKLVGNYVFFLKDGPQYPLTPHNRSIVDSYCTVAPPRQDAIAVGRAAESELER